MKEIKKMDTLLDQIKVLEEEKEEDLMHGACPPSARCQDDGLN